MLRLRSEDVITVGGEEVSARDALARALWRFALTGEVWLAGRQLRAETIEEWAGVVKWLYGYMEPPKVGEVDEEPEMVVRIVHVDEED